MKPVNLEEFQNDFCLTLSQSGHRVEIAKGWGKQGATHYEELTPAILKRILGQNKNINIGILGSVIFEDIEGNRAGDKAIKQKNYLAFDIDLKDSIPDSKEWDYPKKRDFVNNLFYAHKEKIEACGLGAVWFALYSGNGLHVWFRSNSPLKFDSSKDYNTFYLECLKRLKPAICMELDDSCQNPSRLMRLPNSFNCGKPNKPITPIQTEVIYHSKEADSSKEIHGLWFDTLEQPKGREKSNLIPLRKSQGKLPQSDDHKDKVKAALTCEAVLKHCGYDKWDRKKIEGGKTFISSPWSTDSDPSFQIESNFFIDYSSGKRGDVFNLLAYLYEWDVMADFPKVLEIGEQITGIPSPKEIAGKKRQGEANGQSKADSESESKSELRDREDFFKLFRKHLPEACKNKIGGASFFRDYIEKNGAWVETESAIGWLQSEASELGLKPHKVGYHLENFSRNHLETKLLLPKEIPQWDGKDHISEILNHVHLKQGTGITHAHFLEYFKEFGSKLFEKLDDSSIQNPILLLVGAKKLGKSYLIDSIFEGLGETNYAQGFLGNDPIENSRLLASACLLFLDEYELVVKGNQKHMIFKPTARIRNMYKNSFNNVPLKCSFIGTSNKGPRDILTDPDGTRRHLIFEVERIDRYQKEGRSLQVLSQFKALASKGGFRVSQETTEAMELYLETRAPLSQKEKERQTVLKIFDEQMNLHSPDSTIENPLIQTKSNKEQEKSGKLELVKQILDEVIRLSGFKWDTVVTILGENGRSDLRARGGKRRIYLPKEG